MLDTETKRRIDTARDILVGKVPDPKSQVEQITIALIYKFMDDMDAESEELGGKRKFFTGKFAQYGWPKLMHSGLGGHEVLALYAEAISTMPQNPGIPALFRDIFKNAYLPYRDPETLKSFLKIIDGFTYDHSERLGDAFEYLLSVLGSQGDAGQFRTPRHIIDFIVSIVDPKKGDVILDPACGTAGFLISTYKHILRASTDAKKPLTPDEKLRLAKNLKGYDISPDMVRLSLVNLYLHGFNNPNVIEYDTLTSDEHWNQYADVILANPPFMSPKGGIKPHKRFSIDAKRSEVLFVDYIAEHLTPTGRAGIIVPEGIIFQSGTAYKQLRKMLVDTSLVAVVSLPAGVFNPYSGVKTSILILDKSLAKQSDTIGFFKMENDGFGLGAQRRAIEKNDMPQVRIDLETYLSSLRGHQPTAGLTFKNGLIVPKTKIATNGDFNLSGDRYNGQKSLLQIQWPLVSLGTICTFMTGGTPTSTVAEYYENGDVPWLVSGDIHEFEIWNCEKRITQTALENSNARVLPKNSVLIALNGQGKTRGTVALLRMDGATCNQSLVAISPVDLSQLIPEYLFRVLRSMYADIRSLTGDTERSGLNIPILKSIEIPLPPLEIQQELVAEIESYQKVINGARAVLDNYRPQIPINPDWIETELGEVCESIMTGPFGTSLHQSDYTENGIPLVNPQDIVDGKINLDRIKRVSTDTRDRLKEFTLKEHDIVIGRRGEMGRCAVISNEMTGWLCGTGCFVIRLKDICEAAFAFHQLTSPVVKSYLEQNAVGVTLLNLNQGVLSTVPFKLPPLATQQAIVAEIEAEQALVAANRELIARFERKIQATLARVWGEPEAGEEAGPLRG